MEKRSPEFSQISIFGHVRRFMKPGSLQPHIGKWAFCTDIRITFLGSPFPQLLFDIVITLVQIRYRGKGRPEFPQISTLGPVCRCMKPGSYQPRTGKCAFCTNTRITCLGSPFPQLTFDIIVALVHTRYRGERKPRISSNFYIRPYSAQHKTG